MTNIEKFIEKLKSDMEREKKYSDDLSFPHDERLIALGGYRTIFSIINELTLLLNEKPEASNNDDE